MTEYLLLASLCEEEKGETTFEEWLTASLQAVSSWAGEGGRESGELGVGVQGSCAASQ